MISAKTTINWLLPFALVGLVACTQVPSVPYYPPPEGSLSMHGGWVSDTPVVGISASGNPTVLWAERWYGCNYGGFSHVCNSRRELNLKTWNDQTLTWDYKQIGTNGSAPGAPNYYLGQNNVPYAVFWDNDNIIKRWNGESWIPVYGELRFDFPPNYYLTFSHYLLDSHDYPVMTGVISTGSPDPVHELLVYHWDGTKWAQLGQALERFQGDNKSFRFSSTALDAKNYPTVAFVSYQPYQHPVDPGTNIDDLRVKRWSGTEWVALGNQLNDAIVVVEPPQVRLDPKGNPVVAFNQSNKDRVGYYSQVTVKRWNGQDWVELGSFPKASNAFISMDLDSKGNPVIAFLENLHGCCLPSGVEGLPSEVEGETIVVLRWDGTSWTKLDTIRKPSEARGLRTPRLAIWARGVLVTYLQNYVTNDPTGHGIEYQNHYLYAEMRGL